MIQILEILLIILYALQDKNFSFGPAIMSKLMDYFELYGGLVGSFGYTYSSSFFSRFQVTSCKPTLTPPAPQPTWPPFSTR